MEAKERRQQGPTLTLAGGDPDLDGIVAGPQPLAEWQLEGLATFEEADEADEKSRGRTAEPPASAARPAGLGTAKRRAP